MPHNENRPGRSRTSDELIRSYTNKTTKSAMGKPRNPSSSTRGRILLSSASGARINSGPAKNLAPSFVAPPTSDAQANKAPAQRENRDERGIKRPRFRKNKKVESSAKKPYVPHDEKTTPAENTKPQTKKSSSKNIPLVKKTPVEDKATQVKPSTTGIHEQKSSSQDKDTVTPKSSAPTQTAQESSPVHSEGAHAQDGINTQDSPVVRSDSHTWVENSAPENMNEKLPSSNVSHVDDKHDSVRYSVDSRNDAEQVDSKEEKVNSFKGTETSVSKTEENNSSSSKTDRPLSSTPTATEGTSSTGGNAESLTVKNDSTNESSSSEDSSRVAPPSHRRGFWSRDKHQSANSRSAMEVIEKVKRENRKNELARLARQEEEKKKEDINEEMPSPVPSFPVPTVPDTHAEDSTTTGNPEFVGEVSEEEKTTPGTNGVELAPTKIEKKKKKTGAFRKFAFTWLGLIVVGGACAGAFGYSVNLANEQQKVESQAYQRGVNDTEEKPSIENIVRISEGDITELIKSSPGASLPANPKLEKYELTGYSKPGGTEKKSTAELGFCYSGDGVDKPLRGSAYLVTDNGQESKPTWVVDMISLTGEPCQGEK